MEDHIKWSQEDEHILAPEDLVTLNIHGQRHEDDHRGCVYETESVDEGMDEPDCCIHTGVHTDSSNSKEGESAYSNQCVLETEDISTAEQMPDSCVEGDATSYGGQYAPWMIGEDDADVAAHVYNAGFDGFSENHNLGCMDLGFLPGEVIGEILGNEEWLNEPMAPALHSEWADPESQGDWIFPSEDIPGDQVEFSQLFELTRDEYQSDGIPRMKTNADAPDAGNQATGSNGPARASHSDALDRERWSCVRND